MLRKRQLENIFRICCCMQTRPGAIVEDHDKKGSKHTLMSLPFSAQHDSFSCRLLSTFDSWDGLGGMSECHWAR